MTGVRIGIDVGGTNTDAVLMDGLRVAASIKTSTTADVTSGIVSALRSLIADAGTAVADIEAVMIGTTHFTNAVVEAKRLVPTAAVRLRPPAAPAPPPPLGWPGGAGGGGGQPAHPSPRGPPGGRGAGSPPPPREPRGRAPR